MDPLVESALTAAARATGLDPALLRAVALVESGGNPRAVSPAGALGLMQLMPSTARALGVSDPFNAFENALAGARFLRELLGRYGGNIDLALAAYNAGPGAVDRYGGIPPYAETQTYVRRVKAAAGTSPTSAAPSRPTPTPLSGGALARTERSRALTEAGTAPPSNPYAQLPGGLLSRLADLYADARPVRSFLEYYAQILGV